MAKYIRQFRYYGENNAENYPPGLTYTQLRTGSVFKEYAPITQLGIQTNPDFKFYLNDSTAPIIVGSTGIYELDLEGVGRVYNLRFDSESLDEIIRHNGAAEENNRYGLIVDMVYEGANPNT